MDGREVHAASMGIGAKHVLLIVQSASLSGYHSKCKVLKARSRTCVASFWKLAIR